MEGGNAREDMLSNYKELQKGLSETLAMQSEGDEEVEALIHEFEEQLEVLAAALNEGETIEVTPKLHKAQIPNGENGATSTIVIFPPPLSAPPEAKPASASSVVDLDNPDAAASASPSGISLQCAPYEVFYDDRAWYPCVITGIEPPASSIERVRYRVQILGYPVEDVVFSESLRPWRATTLSAQLRSGVACHAIHPITGLYEPANVVRLTLDGTVIVSFSNEAESKQGNGGMRGAQKQPSEAGTGKEKEGHDRVEVELPLSHVHIGRFYPVLRKRLQLTEEEREARRAENAQRKRERIQLEKQLKMDQIAQDANDWKSLMGDLMGVHTNKKPRR